MAKRLWGWLLVFALLGAPDGTLAAVGRTPGAGDVSQTGDATYTIPIFTPPGTAGLTPQLAFTYSSSNGASPVGVGWGIAGLSRIDRCPTIWASDGTSRNVLGTMADRFCLDGVQLKYVSGPAYGGAGTRYASEIENFARIISYGAAGFGPAYFVVERKDGLIYEYGNSADSRIELGGSSTARVWALNKIRDRVGNSILFNYTEDAANSSYRIDTIQYTSNASQGISAPYQVKFVYESLPSNEVDVSFMAGSLIQRLTRMDRVEVTYNSTLVRRYELTFEAALSSTSRSRLQFVQECAGSPSECLEATTFTYQNGTPGLAAPVASGSYPVTPLPMDVNGDGRTDLTFPSTNTGGTWMVSFANADGTYASAVSTGIGATNFTQAIPIDYNADGRDDLLVPYAGGTWWALLGADTGLSGPFDTGIPATGASQGRATSMDVNGDGLDDLVYLDSNILYERTRIVGGTFSAAAAYPFPAGWQITSGFGSAGPQFRARNRQPSFNGDARKGFLVRVFVPADPEGQPVVSKLWQIVQSGNSMDEGFFGVQQQNFNAPIKYLDINGDGQTDILYPVTTAGNYRYRLSNGLRLGQERNGPALQSVNFTEAAVIDWEGDGDQDLVAVNTTTGELMLMRSTGETVQGFVGTGLFPGGTTLFVVDSNGDGLDDLMAAGSGNLSRLLHPGTVPDLMDRATDGFGNYLDFNYASLSSSSSCYLRIDFNPPPTYPERPFLEPIPVVCDTTASNGIGGTYSVNYNYYNAQVNLQGRGFQGFVSRRTRDSRDGLNTYRATFQGFPYTGLLAGVDVFQPDNATLIAQSRTYWSAHTYGSGTETRLLPYLSSATTQQREVGGAFNGVLIRSSATTNVVDAATGTLTDTTTTVTEGSNANGLNAGASYIFRTYSPTLFNDFTNWCFGRPTRTQQINSHTLFGGALKTRTLDTNWDGLYCRPTDSVIEPGNPTRQVTTQLAYDAFGNPQTQTVTPVGQAARVTQLNWGADGQFPLTATNALSQATTLAWWPTLGQLRSSTDPNQLTTNLDYDAFGRPTSQVAPDSTSTLTEYLPCDADCSGFANTRYKIRSTLRDTTGGTIAQGFVLLDALERPRRNSSYALEGGLINQLTEYDALGRIARSSTPYFHFAGTPVWTTFTYDVLDRQRQATRDRTSDVDSSASTSTLDYNGLTVTSTDPLGKVRLDTIDPLGQILRAIQASGTVDQSTTSYDYDAFGSLVRTTDGMGNQASIDYDVRGFKISSNDPDLGNWTYDYYPTGELKTQTDAKSQVTSFTYDKLSRPLTRVEPSDSGSGTQTTTFTWGTSAASFNIGQLQSVVLGSYSEGYSYDNRSRLTSTTVGADGGSYVIGQSYNATTGLLETLTYPASTGAAPFKVKYEYETANKSGLLQRVKDYNAGTVFWQAVSSNALGQYQDVTLGNGLKTLTAFDSITGVTNRIETGPGGGTARQSLQYSWDKLGNVLSRQDFNIAKTETFNYDNLYRLTQAQVTGNAALTVSYNQIGNITNKSDVGAYAYHPTKKHAVATAGGLSITYDANGNILTQTSASGTSTVNWTAYNLPKLISTSASNSSTFLYGPDRQRYKQVASFSGGTETTVYIKGVLERLSGVFGIEYRHLILGPDGVIAVHNRRSSGTNETLYLLKDHLGSTDVITDAAGASRVKLSFSAFGARRNGATWNGPPTPSDGFFLSGTSRLAFTGHEQLDHLDLVHMNGRVYQPMLGRFLSADPFVQAPFNSQSLNRYSYVFNNPLSFTDPSGFNGDRNGKESTYNINDVLGTKGRAIPLEGGGGGRVGQRDLTFGTEIGYEIFAQTKGGSPPPRRRTTNSIPLDVPGLGALNGAEGFMTASAVGGRPNLGLTLLSIGVGFVPIASSFQSIGELITGRDVITGEQTSRALAAVGIVAGLVGAKGLLKGASKADDIVEGVADIARRTCCFVAGTLVMTEAGLRPIEEVAVGERVLSRDETTGETAYKPVTELIRRHDREIWILKLQVDDQPGETIVIFETTDDHPWRSADNRWLATAELSVGAKILRANGMPAVVMSADRANRTAPTFNLEIADFHTYFVGEAGVWVHNSICNPKFLGKSPREILDALPDGQIKLVQQFLGTGDKGLARLAANFQVPAGLQRETVEAYVELVKRSIGENAGKERVRILVDRLAVLERALKELP